MNNDRFIDQIGNNRGRWIVCQIGAREHYAIARALHQAGRLAALITDFWCPPKSLLAKLPGVGRMRDRWHPDLDDANVIAPNLAMFKFEAWARVNKISGWPLVLARNEFFQRQAIDIIRSVTAPEDDISFLFSYSYAADALFYFAKLQGWRTILGQIDPGPEEQRIVEREHSRYPHIGSRWEPAPDEYWSNWKREIDLSDRVVINSEWSRVCLLKEGIDDRKLVEIPLVYQLDQTEVPVGCARKENREQHATPNISDNRRFKILFLGQINLRKGVGRLLDAMRILKNEPIELTLAGPTEIDPSAWSDLPHVRWIGPIPRSKVGEIYVQSDLFILPTLSDGYALTQLEALAYDLPVMRSIYCGDPFISVNNDMLLDSLEPEDVSAVLMRVSKSEEFLAYKQKIKCFSIHDLAESLTSVIHSTSTRYPESALEPTDPCRTGSSSMSDSEPPQSNDAVAETFTTISDLYAAHFQPAKTGTHVCFQKRLELVLEMTAGRTGAILDCAVGPAEITAELLRQQHFDRAELVDISPAMIEKARVLVHSRVPPENATGISFVTGDIFDVAPSLPAQSFDLIFCVGLIAHTGRLDQMLANLRPLLAPGGQILLQSTLMDHYGTKIVRILTASRYRSKFNYDITYYYHDDIAQSCKRNGLRIASVRRFSLGLPFADRIWKWANYHAETRLSSFAARFGSEALYLIESDTSE